MVIWVDTTIGCDVSGGLCVWVVGLTVGAVEVTTCWVVVAREVVDVDDDVVIGKPVVGPGVSVDTWTILGIQPGLNIVSFLFWLNFSYVKVEFIRIEKKTDCLFTSIAKSDFPLVPITPSKII